MSHHKFRRDRLINTSQRGAASAAMTVIDRLQSHPPDEQVAGLTAAFLLMLDAYGVSVQDAMTITRNLIHDSHKRLLPEFRAVAAYMRGELV